MANKKGGRKDDSEKNQLELVDPEFTEGVGRILTFGAKKYDAHNWMQGIVYSRVIGAIKRHTSAIERGEDIDPESGQLHAYHLACETMFLARFQSHPEWYGDLDDRAFATGREPPCPIPS